MKLLRFSPIFVLLLTAGIALAKSPDGLTPGEETICDSLKSATNGLYGLCVAYCEAKDFDFLNSPEPTNSQINILKAYNKLKTDADPDMPCIQTTDCPCFTYQQALAAFQPKLLNGCGDYSQFYLDQVWIERLLEVIGYDEPDDSGSPAVGSSYFASVMKTGEPNHVLSCNFANVGDSFSSWNGDFFSEIDRDKFDACIEILEAAKAETSSVCEVQYDCKQRVFITGPTEIDGLSVVDVWGSLINEPNDYCVNDDAFAYVEWYWGDGTVDTFTQNLDGYVYPFPSSHTYTEAGTFLIAIWAFNEYDVAIGMAGYTITVN